MGKSKNNLLLEKLVYTGTSEIEPHLTLVSYNEHELQEAKGKNIKSIIDSIKCDCVNWLTTCGMKDTEVVREVCEHFEIDFLVLQDILNANHLTKIEEHDKYIVFITKIFRPNENIEEELTQQQVAIILGSNFVLTFLEKETQLFDDISTAIKSNTLRIRQKQSDYLFSVVINSVVGNYINIVSTIDDSLEDLEEELLKITNAKDIGIQIQSLRRQYMQIKRAVLPLKEQYSKLLRSTSTLIHKVNHPFFDDVNDHLQFVLQTIEICRETLSSLVDLYISNNDLKMNEIMKRLTVVSTIFIPLTFLVGVWGMNFEFMPELSWKHGYLFAWGLMLLVGVGGYLFFKRKKWY
ncbi:magnesium and cobalt transport protein CorA [Bacteroides sp. 214]|uniref:magnesium/cobalt transporter CorA n=1 Tax=Bacteroides sp. 214 TaxID=2302935 RepID=UPI0013D34DF5|nr:magnesium/cobalt transporter CorA [Bacteroides sp. 214]NDW11953.1 magnesium and cobalt transport protein CorA [Bacteroides sp. 214]